MDHVSIDTKQECAWAMESWHHMLKEAGHLIATIIFMK